MKAGIIRRADWCCQGSVLAFLFSALVCAQAQTIIINPAPQGDNGAWLDSMHIKGTSGFVDATAWCPGNPANCDQADFCQVVNSALTGLPPSGGVIDARGVVKSDGKDIPCSSNPFPQSNTVPVTLLLPSSVIDIQATWVLPSNTRIIGEGRKTILRATGPTFAADSKNAMVEMGSSAVCPSSGCTSISVEHLKLDGSNLPAAARVLGV